MSIETSVYKPRTLEKLISIMPPVRTFFRSTFFRNTKTFVTARVDVDYKKGGRALAPFVHPKLGSKTILNTGYETKSYTAPLIAPKKITTEEDLTTRSAGENPYSGRTPADRAVEKVTADLAELREMITRRIEWMCAQLLFTGTIPVKGESVDETITFDFTNTTTLTGTALWSNANADPINDLETWRKQVQKEGFANCNICVMSPDVSNVFVNNPKVQKLLDIKAYDLAVIKPREMANGLTYIGTINKLGLDIYEYNEWYLDTWTDPANPVNKPLVPEKTVALFSTSAQFSMYYGAITLMGNNDNFITVEGETIPESWSERDPARRFLKLSSRPLPVPHEINSWYVAKVL